MKSINKKEEQQHSKFLAEYYIRSWVLFLLLIVFITSRFSQLFILTWLLYFLMFIQLMRSVRAAYHIEKLALLFSKRGKPEFICLHLPPVKIWVISMSYYIGLILNLLFLYNIYKNNLSWFLFLLFINFLWDLIFSMISKNHLDNKEFFYNEHLKFSHKLNNLKKDNTENDFNYFTEQAKNNPNMFMRNKHMVIKLKCPFCEHTGETTYGSIEFKILGKDEAGWMCFECPKCRKHLRFDPITGDIDKIK